MSNATRQLLAPRLAHIQGAHGLFRQSIASTLHQLSPIGLSPEIKSALESAFTNRVGLVKDMLDAINLGFEESGVVTCPYCNFGEQWEADHYLPKATFPEFALFHPNLVPICKPCNGQKKGKYRANDLRMYIYALAELQNAEGILRVRVQYDPKLKVTYQLNDPGDLPDGVFDVLTRHFTDLKLAQRYRRQATTTISTLIKNLRKPQTLNGTRTKLRSRLRRMADDRADQCPSNHWEVELLRCLGRNLDFANFVFQADA